MSGPAEFHGGLPRVTIRRSGRIRSVTQRVYRGFCAHNDGIPAAVARFQKVRGALESLFSRGEVSERRRENALKYIARFYAIIENEGELKAQVYDACRGGD